jgi:DNA-binding transcriptional MerR regulator
VVVSGASAGGSQREEAIVSREYYSIGDACDIAGVKPHVLRYWESRLDVLHPQKNRAGKRVFRASDIELILLVKRLLYQEAYTIEGARRRLDEMRRSEGPQPERRGALDRELLAAIEADLVELREVLSPPVSTRGR